MERGGGGSQEDERWRRAASMRQPAGERETTAAAVVAVATVMTTGNAAPPPSWDLATTILMTPANAHCGGSSWRRESRRRCRWRTRTRRVQQRGHPSPRLRTLRTTPMVATAALQLSAVRLRMWLRGQGPQQWAVAALDDGYNYSNRFIIVT